MRCNDEIRVHFVSADSLHAQKQKDPHTIVQLVSRFGMIRPMVVKTHLAPMTVVFPLNMTLSITKYKTDGIDVSATRVSLLFNPAFEYYNFLTSKEQGQRRQCAIFALEPLH